MGKGGEEGGYVLSFWSLENATAVLQVWGVYGLALVDGLYEITFLGGRQ
jgi:hypothetical protein